MPYIPKEDRAELDDAIDALALKIVARAEAAGHDASFAGLLNYASTRLALEVIRKRFGKIRYWIVALVSGTFKNVGDEFYRRLATPYEDRQMEKNGDVDLYSAYAKDLEKDA